MRLLNWQALLAAVTLLTRLPVPARWQTLAHDPPLRSRAVVFYPLVGAMLAALLLALAAVMPDKLGVTAQAAVLVGVWIGLTGVLHLDGLADTVDALAAAHRDPARLQEVLKDPRLGTAGACVLVLLILLKVALLRTALETGTVWIALPAALIAARLLAVIYMMMTPYARDQGLASQLDLQPLQWAVVIMSLVALLLAMVLLGRLAGTALAVVLAAWLVYWQQRWLKLVGGYTGDCVGALIEVAELLVLVVVVLAL